VRSRARERAKEIRRAASQGAFKVARCHCSFSSSKIRPPLNYIISRAQSGESCRWIFGLFFATRLAQNFKEKAYVMADVIIIYYPSSASEGNTCHIS
jgi:hypothetical protein